jgi:hypothetical protein
MNRSFAPLDRRSTQDEIRSALSLSAQVILLDCNIDDLSAADTDLSPTSSNLIEDDMWSAIAHEMPYSKSN